MSRDLRTLMESVAPQPTIRLDEKQLVGKAIRQRKIVRLSTLAAGVVVLAASIVGAIQVVAGTDLVEVVDRPPADAPTGPTAAEGGAVTKGVWTQVPGGTELFGGAGDQVAAGVANGPNGFVTVGVDEGRAEVNEDDAAVVWTSPDGSSWHRAASFRDAGMTDVVWFEAGGIYVAVGNRVSSGAVWISEDTTAWRQTATIDYQPGGGIDLLAVTSTDTRLVVVGQEWLSEGHAIPAAWTSADGHSWTRADVDPAPTDGEAAMTDVADLGSGLVAVGHLGSGTEAVPVVWVSRDGESWEAVASGNAFGDVSLTAVASDGKRITAVGDDRAADTASLWTSTDQGRTWQQIDLDGTPRRGALSLRDVAVSPNGWVTVGAEFSPDGTQSAAIVLGSEDGVTWHQAGTVQSAPRPDGEGAGAAIQAVAPHTRLLTAVGYQGRACVLRHSECDLDVAVWISEPAEVGDAGESRESADPSPLPDANAIAADHASAPLADPEVVDGQAAVPLRLPDGTWLELSFPAELDFTTHGFDSWVPAVGLPGFERDAMVLYGSREQVRDRMDATVLDTYPDQRGGEVEFWRLEQDEVDHLAFEFGPWTVLYYDYREGGAGPRMTDQDRQLFAESLIGEVGEDGFLVVEATPPLEFYTEGAHAAGISITGDSGTINITNARCDPYPDQPLRGPGDDYLHWCDEDTGFSIRVFADSEVLDAVEDRVTVARAD